MKRFGWTILSFVVTVVDAQECIASPTSVQISENLVVDTSSLVVDSVNNRVGVGTASPTVTLDVNGSARFGTDYRASTWKNLSGNSGATLDSGSTPHVRIGNNLYLDGSYIGRNSASELFTAGAGAAWINNIGGTYKPGVQIHGRGTGSAPDLLSAGVLVVDYRNATSSNGGGHLYLGSSRSDTRGTLGGVISSGDEMGYVYFVGDDGTNLEVGALIKATVNGTPGSNDMPGKLHLATTPDGSATASDSLTIDQAGHVNVVRGSLGVGQTSPAYPLHVGSTSSKAIAATTNTNTKGTAGFTLRTDTNYESIIDAIECVHIFLCSNSGAAILINRGVKYVT